MSIPLLAIRHQGPVLAALGRTALASLAGTPTGHGDCGPAAELRANVGAPPSSLVHDYVTRMGGERQAYAELIPVHMFPQWGFPLLARTLRDLPYPLSRIINLGCRIESRAPLPQGRPLSLRAHRVGVDDDGKRAKIHQQLVTGTPEAPDALSVDVHALVPLSTGAPNGTKEKPSVPLGLQEVGQLQLVRTAGLEFALLTGDVNPIHWSAFYARMFGFPGVILQGFGTLAHAFELLVRNQWGGDPTRFRSLEVRFVRPLVLPATVGVFLGPDGTLAVGTAPSEPAFLLGRVATA